jgi:hypothetical protein
LLPAQRLGDGAGLRYRKGQAIQAVKQCKVFRDVEPVFREEFHTFLDASAGIE